jgi:hypothetical protein
MPVRDHLIRWLLAAVALSLLWPVSGWAQTRATGERRLEPKAKVAPPKGRAMRAKPSPTQRIIFEDDIIKAGRGTGAGTMITGEKRTRFSKLIKVRANFIDLLIKDAEDI